MTTSTAVNGSDALDDVLAVLADSLLALASTGRADQASGLAGRAYAALRHEHPAAAQQVNVLMHTLVAMPTTIQEQKMETTEPQLDVRLEAPMQRHHLIFESYDHLSPGEAFVLVNDHDPKPLYYQFEAEHPGRFTWTYLEEGPEVWRVRIGRPVPVTS